MSNLTGKNIFVTGATGLVGSHLVERLLKEKPAKIICLVRSHDPRAYFYLDNLDKKVVLAYGDLQDKERMFNIITKYEISHIFHIGAQAIVPTVFLNPHEAIKTNVLGAANILEAARLSPLIEAVVVASSDKVYGKDCIDATEKNALVGDHPYDASKSAADLLAISYHRTYGLPVVISRFGNIFGPGDLNFNRIIPGIMKSLVTNEVLELRSDGSFKRDYVYVGDVVDGYVCLAGQIAVVKGEVFNFSSGYNFSVLELIDKIGHVLDAKVNFEVRNNQENEIPSQSLNCKKAENMLGWKAKSDFSDSIKETFRWYQNNLI